MQVWCIPDLVSIGKPPVMLKPEMFECCTRLQLAHALADKFPQQWVKILGRRVGNTDWDHHGHSQSMQPTLLRLTVYNRIDVLKHALSTQQATVPGEGSTNLPVPACSGLQD